MHCDVVVVGAGNAALCAALSAREAGADVLVLERAPYAARGGNTAFTGGAMRVVYNGPSDILELVPDLAEEQLASTDFGTYTFENFFDDLARTTEHRVDGDLAEILARRSFDTLKWMTQKGVRFIPSYGRQAFEVDGRYRFWGGLAIEASGGGPGLVEGLNKAAESAGIRVAYGARAVALRTDRGRVDGLTFRQQGETHVVKAGAVVLACGGFQANSEWRTRYLGPGWDLAKVRGTSYNTGDGIRMALDIGAMSWGNWSGAHAVAWDYNAPPFGDLAIGDSYQKHSYPFSLMANARGERFLDEGADFRNYTYAKNGHIILAQPGQLAWQVFDRKVSHLLRDEYRIRQTTKVTGATIEELAARMYESDAEAAATFVRTVRAFNAAVSDENSFNPTIKDGRRTTGLAVDKTNWANTIDEPPLEAYAVTCGITFTFGGLRITTDAQVISDDHEPIDGLYACGELVGGIFYHNYPGGSGLTSGAVFGRIAGANAAKRGIGAQ